MFVRRRRSSCGDDSYYSQPAGYRGAGWRLFKVRSTGRLFTLSRAS